MSYEPILSTTLDDHQAGLDEDELRTQLSEYSTQLKRKGLTSATGGNMSYRLGEDMLISPTGRGLDELRPQDWVRVCLETAEVYPGQGKPSSEVYMHRNIYQLNSGANAIIHSHPPHVIALSLVGLTILPIGSEAPFLLGEKVPLIPYAIPTSPLLAEAVKPYAEKYNVMILENHGLVTTGKDNREAFNRTELSEEIARIMYIAMSMGRGEPKWPSDQDIREYLDWIYYRKLP